MLAIAALLTFPASGAAAGVRWSANAGVGRLTELGQYINPSPRTYGSVAMRLTEGIDLGLAGDYTWFNSALSSRGGSAARGLLVLRWRSSPYWLPRRVRPFGEIGLGVGYMHWVDIVASPSGGSYDLFAPASRLAAGLEIGLVDRAALTATFSFDRNDAVVDPLDRRYPTMLAFSLGLAVDLPRGRPLFAPVNPPRDSIDGR